MTDTPSQTGDTFRHRGHVLVGRVSLHRKPGDSGIDLVPFMVEIDIFEDIFSPSMSASLLLSDSIALSSGFPLVGGESVQVEFKTPGANDAYTIRKRFIVYKLEDKLIVGMKSVYVLLSEYAYTDNKIRLSKKYNGNAVSVIKSILTSDLGVDLTNTPLLYDKSEDSRNGISFIAPNWSPITVINRITSLCADVDTVVSDGALAAYLFFESNKGFNFWSLSNLTVINKNSGPKALGNEYFYDQNPNRAKGMRDAKKEMQQIQDMRIDTQFDMLTRMSTGVYKNQVINFDVIKKTATVLPPYDYMKSVETQMYRMNEFPISPKGSDFGDGKLTAHASFNKAISDIDMSINPVKNRIALGLMNSVVIEITIYGRTDIEVGDQLYLNMPDATNAEVGKSSLDQVISGNYVITAIQHRINEFKHSMIVRLSTDSYSVNVT